MSISRVFAPADSANEIFKSQYQTNLRWAVLAAVLATVMMAWISPRYVPTPYQLPDEALILQKVEVIYETIEPPAVKPAPVIPPEIEVVDKDYTGPLDPLDITGPWDKFYNPEPSYPAPKDTDFVASSTKPRLVSRTKPHYPEVARLAQVEGTVIVQVLVGVDGTVKAAQVVQAAHPLLNNAALKAAWKCVFKAGQQRQIKVEAWVAVPYNFKLR